MICGMARAGEVTGMVPRGWGLVAVRRSGVIVALSALLATTAGAAASRPWPQDGDGCQLV